MTFSLSSSIIYKIISSFSNFPYKKTNIKSEEIHDLIKLAQIEFEKEPILINLPSNINVVGDLHGNVVDLLRILEKVGYPPEKKFLFLGDYVDRGKNSVEVMCMLIALKVKYPNSVYLLRGNHETKSICSSYGFLSEIIEKYDNDLFKSFNKMFTYLPIAAIIDEKILCVHGGISSKMKKLSQLTELKKPGEFLDDDSIITDILWSDPSEYPAGFAPNTRGFGCYFNKTVLVDFLNANNLTMLIRSHELCYEGYDYPYLDSEACLTIFSSSNYNSKGNTATVAYVDDQLRVSISFLNTVEKMGGSKNIKITLPHWLVNELEVQKANGKLENISVTFSPLNKNLMNLL